jgi:putative ABC transport system permease protein
MISMRIHSLKGVLVEKLRRQQGRGGWALGREYRSTYREALAPTEKLVAGEWVARVDSLDEPVPISMEVDLARRLRLELGDELVFDVQGIQVPCVVASLREVDWRRLSPNFFVVFPAGAIEAAPAVHAMVTRVDSSAASAGMQREVVEKFPNVSAVDLTLILQTVDDIVGKISGVVRLMAAFTVGTGLLVLAGAIASGRRERLRESILLRTLGATRGQVMKILAAEYLLLGTLAALNGILLANLGAWAAGRWVFQTSFEWRPLPALIALCSVVALTLAAGLLGNRKLLNRPPLEVLRVEQ